MDQNNEQLYYVLSVKWSKTDSSRETYPVLTWWKPNAAGYTFNIDNAGKYTNSEIEESQGYYNNGYDTLAVPIEDVEKYIQKTISWDAIYELVGYKGKVPDLRPGSCGEDND